MVSLVVYMFFFGRFTSFGAALKTWLPFCIMAGLCGYFGRLIFLYVYLGITVPLVVWFLFYTFVLQRQVSRGVCLQSSRVL